MNSVYLSFSKWWCTIKLFWANTLTYRADFFLQVVAPGIVFLFIKYHVWTTIYKGSEELVIGNFSLEEMIQYQIWGFLILLMTMGHRAMNLAEEIRMGRISTYLIYPMNFWEHHTAGFFAFQFIQTLVCIFTLILFLLIGITELPSFSYFLGGYLYCLLVSLLWFSIQYGTGLLAFWLDETWMIRVMIQIITLFLSGAFVPLDFYPEAFQHFLHYTPFPYLAYYPIKIFTGEVHDLLFSSSIIGLWLILSLLINRFLWKKGLKLYTAAGM